MPDATDDLAHVRELLARHGLPDAEPRPAPHQGDANRTYLAGGYVIRLARPDVLEDWRTELFAHPYVHARGIRTPRLIAGGEFYTILERIEGRNMDADASEAFFRDLGVQLARLHALPFPEDPEKMLDDHAGPAPIDLEHLDEALRPLAERLDSWANLTNETFIHGDLLPGNVLVGPGGEATLIDWGDAGRGHAAYDLAFVPLVGLPSTLAAYAVAGGTVDADLRRRLVALRLETVAYRASVGERAWTDEALEHRELLERLAR